MLRFSSVFVAKNETYYVTCVPCRSTTRGSKDLPLTSSDVPGPKKASVLPVIGHRTLASHNTKHLFTQVRRVSEYVSLSVSPNDLTAKDWSSESYLRWAYLLKAALILLAFLGQSVILWEQGFAGVYLNTSRESCISPNLALEVHRGSPDPVNMHARLPCSMCQESLQVEGQNFDHP